MSSPSGQDLVLTVQESAVLAASATGRGVAEIAECLGVSPDVVRQSLASAIAKLGARSKLEAVVIALRCGLISVPAC
jgi:DNA-binding CsgD family transcriptional regulator